MSRDDRMQYEIDPSDRWDIDLALWSPQPGEPVEPLPPEADERTYCRDHWA